jgi:hypothetical protein
LQLDAGLIVIDPAVAIDQTKRPFGMLGVADGGYVDARVGIHFVSLPYSWQAKEFRSWDTILMTGNTFGQSNFPFRLPRSVDALVPGFLSSVDLNKDGLGRWSAAQLTLLRSKFGSLVTNEAKQPVATDHDDTGLPFTAAK